MILKEIRINKYKSLCSGQNIELSKGITTLLGRNGSGKTNILEALNLFFNLPTAAVVKGFLEPEYRAKIEIDYNDAKDYGLENDFNNQSKIIEIHFASLNFEDKKIVSSIISVSLNRIKNRIKVFCDNIVGTVLQCVEILKECGFKEGVKKCNCFSDNVVKFKDGILSFIKGSLHNDTFKISVQNKTEIKFSPDDIKLLLEKSTSSQINEHQRTDYQKKLDEFHGYICEEFFKLSDSFNMLNNISDIKNDKSLVSKILKSINKNCYYLDNESGLIFGSHLTNHSYYDSNYGYSIETAFINYLITNKIIKDKAEIKNIKDNEFLKKEFQKFINSSMPRFDSKMFKGIEVELENGAFQLYILENNGSRVNFNSTSLGRRWYFTYIFIKNCLKKGDIFLIDEPASFLHPQAQSEILESLEELANKGITVIISTHSPYMISDQSNFIHVSMTEEGTVVKKQDLDNTAHIKADMGLIPYNDLLLNLTRQIILVEGYKDVSCLHTFMKLFQIDESNYYVFHTSGAHQMPYLKRFFDENYINYKILLDADTLEWKKNADGLSEEERLNRNRVVDFISAHRNDKNIIYVGENKKPRCMEGLFSEHDREKYFSLSNGRLRKVSPEKLENAKSLKDFDNETVLEFEKLFVKLDIL